MKTGYKLQYPDLIQPKDKTHALYALLDQFIIDGDQKEIATRLGIKNDSVVCDVKKCRRRSRRVWDQLVSTAMKRKTEQDRVVKYLQSPVQNQKAA